MAQKTWKRQFSERDAMISRERSFLATSDDSAAICYEYEKSGDDSGGPAGQPAIDQIPAATSQAQPAPALPARAPPAAAAETVPVLVEDSPLKPLDVIISIVAQKLRKPFDQLPLDKTLRDLCAGKSTLQNELIGDVGAEFGTAPDGCEDVALEGVASAVASGFTGSPGKTMLKLVQRLVSSKMPAGLNVPALKRHLEAAWGLPAGRQWSVICFAVTLEPAQRLPSTEAAEAFLDDVAKRYASFAGVTLARGGANEQQPQPQHAAINEAGLAALTEKQDGQFRKQLELLSRQSGLHDAEDVKQKQLEEAEEARDAAVSLLKQWHEEFDEDFLDRIRPSFDAKKERRYDSAWNWVREDLVALFHGQGGIDEAALQHLLNRWDASCTAIAAHYAEKNAHVAAVAGMLLKRAPKPQATRPVFKYLLPPMRPQTTVTPEGAVHYQEVPRLKEDCEQIGGYAAFIASSSPVPHIHLRRRRVDTNGDGWAYDGSATTQLLDALAEGSTAGLNFSGKTALVTGAGAGSIGAEVVRGLLAGGARIVVTTSRAPAAVAGFYNAMYRECGAAGAELVVFPFNQGSAQDCAALVEHLYARGGDLDFVLPFAAVTEPTARELDGISAHSELAYRVMFVNLMRLLGHIKQHKEKRGLRTRPTNIILPLSPNHGQFGGDGLYSASKISLETLLYRFESESWSTYLTITGAVIGWTRGTGLMGTNDTIAEAVERHGCVTFSQREMAFNILALMSPTVVELCEVEPVYADLRGGLASVPGLKKIMSAAREEISQQSRVRKALVAERRRHDEVLGATSVKPPLPPQHAALLPSSPRATIRFNHPTLPPSHGALVAGLPDLQGMVDLSHTIVVVGFSELGPWGSARTRWEVEEAGKLSWAGYVEMAWLMGLTRFVDGDAGGKAYVGWVDAKTGEPVHDADFEARYGAYVMAHAGIRTAERVEHEDEVLQEVVVEESLPAYETSRENAEAFKAKHGDKADVWPVASGADEWRVRVRKGARFFVPKAMPRHSPTAGQLPAGWSPQRYGIPDDIAAHADPVALYTVCCVNEALLSAGFRDPYELWQHLHVSELANCVGSGGGNLASLRAVFRDRLLDRARRNDVLPDAFHNALDAWANMLLLSSAGPMRTPAGACATSVESLDTACEALRCGTAKMAIVGGADDYGAEFAAEFGSMRATASPAAEAASGRLPREASRPTAASRAGFVYSAGCGVQVLMTADLALRVGAPIHAIVAHSQTAADKTGRSVPAPGRGVLTAAREDPRAAQTNPLRHLAWRRRQLRDDMAHVRRWQKRKRTQADGAGPEAEAIDAAAAAKVRAAQRLWSADLRAQNPGLSPLRAALMQWGLTVDDVQVASFHGTSTQANDTNESDVVNSQMAHLGRRIGNPLLVVCQKSVTGHQQGAAGAVMLNGCLQILGSGVVPGNRNADRIDKALRQFPHLLYPSKSVRIGAVKAFLLTSFGFGQKGGLVLGVAPRYLFASITKEAYHDYRSRVLPRQEAANHRLAEGFMANDIFRAKSSPPWKPEDEARVLLDPWARVNADSLAFDADSPRSAAVPHPPSAPDDGDNTTGHLAARSRSMIEQLLPAAAALHASETVGVDVESMSSIDTAADNAAFLARNYTDAELAYCRTTGSPHASLVGRWAAKEAVFKSLGVASRGPGAPMREIEVLSKDSVPYVQLHGEAKIAAELQGIKSIQLSISHTDSVAIAIALAAREKDEGMVM
ncbi:hypothetical protein B0J12DRAFT_711184 [Macrophomina phaseolina]|uniref:Fatty acid synthase subunit alpha n=1 Tax=Macrophomina phaseolina TaxID=35725 RepID=A0ABQ8GB96_9PEZI|nr:hypothetical protein B0J12DRAFT_711184 [Macrophomina phaseolina]